MAGDMWTDFGDMRSLCLPLPLDLSGMWRQRSLPPEQPSSLRGSSPMAAPVAFSHRRFWALGPASRSLYSSGHKRGLLGAGKVHSGGGPLFTQACLSNLSQQRAGCDHSGVQGSGPNRWRGRAGAGCIDLAHSWGWALVYGLEGGRWQPVLSFRRSVGEREARQLL